MRDAPDGLIFACRFRPDGAGAFVATLAEVLIAQMTDVIEDMDEERDRLEDAVAATGTPRVRETLAAHAAIHANPPNSSGAHALHAPSRRRHAYCLADLTIVFMASSCRAIVAAGPVALMNHGPPTPSTIAASMR